VVGSNACFQAADVPVARRYAGSPFPSTLAELAAAARTLRLESAVHLGSVRLTREACQPGSRDA